MNYKLILKTVGVVAVSSVLLAGCGGDDDGGGNGNGGGGNNNGGGCSGGGDNSYVYNGPTVKIGSQTWMAKNLDRATDCSKCYKNSADSCAKYGRLYTWSDALTACPSGWHLPTDAEWTALMDAVGGENTAGIKLKTTTGWVGEYGFSVVAATDEYGFSALPGGGCTYNGNFYGIGSFCYFWSATERSAEYAFYRGTSYGNEHMSSGRGLEKGNWFSVRCVKD